MSSIFVKVVDKTVSLTQLSAEIAKTQSVQIEGIPAEKIVQNLEELLNGQNSFTLIAGANIFSDNQALMEEIFDIFESQKINDTAYFYQIWQNSSEQNGFEIYCKKGNSIEIRKIRSN